MTESPSEELTYFPMKRRCPMDPADELARRNAECPVSRVRIWDGSTPWLFTRYDDVRTILTDARLSGDATMPGFPSATAAATTLRRSAPHFLHMDDPDHAKYRRMLTKDFLVKRIDAMRPRIAGIVDDLLDRLVTLTPPVDLVETFAFPVPSMVICELLGVPYTEHVRFERFSRVLGASDTTREQAVAANVDLLDYLKGVVDDKAENPGDDLISHLIVERMRTGELSRDDVAGMGHLMLLAGHDTTSNMISLGVLTLLLHPDQLAEVRDADDPALVVNAVEEMLRYHTIALSGRRRVATEDVVIGGQLVKAGEGLIGASDVANRDERWFPDPDRFDIHRKAKHHMAFGYGIHQCLGQPLARAQLQVAYPALLRRLPTLRLAVPFEEIPFRHDMGIYGLHRLPVAW